MKEGTSCDASDTRAGKQLDITFGDYSDVKCNQSSIKTPELEKFLEVPWEVPKLRKKIANRKKMKTLVNIQGSDSGISMSSQETKDILVTTPWVGTRLKHKSQVYLSCDSNKDPCSDVQHDATLSDKLACADNDSSYASYPGNSINANSEFHFKYQPTNLGNDIILINRKLLHTVWKQPIQPFIRK